LDHVLALAQRLRPALALLVLLLAPVCASAATVGVYPTAMEAQAACTAAAPATVSSNGHDWARQTCHSANTGEYTAWYYSAYYNSYGCPASAGVCSNVYAWQAGTCTGSCVPPEPVNPCTNENAGGGLGPGGYAGKITQGMTWCKAGVPDPNTSGATVSCTASFTPSGPPTMNQWGSWHTPGTLSISGDTCDGSGWKAPNGSAPPAPVPPSPAETPPTNPPPKACGGGSCYDPNNDNFCAVSDGVQICIPGNTARTPGGGCATSGDSTLCAGSPSAPTPPSSQVPDPPTAVTNNDGYTQADPGTGGNQNVTVITYTNQGGTGTTSGQTTGDSGPPATGGDPAPGSSTVSPPGSYSGGGDCGSPPVCTGDAVMCGVARQQWTAMCQAKKDSAQLHKDLTGDGPPSDFDALKTKYAQSDVWSDTPPTGDGGAGDAANAGNYDMSGFGYSGTCPLIDLTVDAGKLGQFVVPFSNACIVGDWVRGLILAMALYSAWLITKGAGMKGVS
jgi:hypothetical protein